MDKPIAVAIVGAGSIGTAIGNVIARKREKEVYLYSIEEDVVKSINEKRNNFKYFPNIKLARFLKATTDPEILRESSVIFLAIPSIVTVDYLVEHQKYLSPGSILLNMAKGFSREHKTIAESLSQKLPNPVCAFKGPTFARELIQKLPTGFTVGSKDPAHFLLLRELFRDTPVRIDFTTDVKGVELLSILKNIYAIAMGIVDAHFNSPNLRFLFLTRAFREMRNILLKYGGQTETMFNYCGYGDFTLTALNDLSRNRTLGLLIGKGFFSDDISDKVVLEGKIAVNVFCNEILKANSVELNYPIIGELYKLFNSDYKISEFVSRVINDTNS
jgi:glycerol-3-phosphate dehydrogenase (NAD(P)+)